MSVDCIPQYPVASEELTLSLSAATGTKFGFELTSAPSTSTLTNGLLFIDKPVGYSYPASPLLGASEKVLSSTFTPDVAGEYTFKAYDMREVVGTPAFGGDPSGETRYELLGTQTGTVKVGALMELPIATTDGNGGTLQLRVVGEYIRGASFVDHLTETGRLAALQDDVVTSLANVVGKSIDDASTDFLPALKELRDKYNGEPLVKTSVGATSGHRARGGNGRVHFAPDTVNVLNAGIPFSLKFAVKLVNDLREKLLGHLEDSMKYAVPAAVAAPYNQWDSFWHFTAEDQTNSTSPVYTTVGSARGTPGADTTTTPIVAVATDLPTATVLLCELRWRVFDRHIRLGHGPASDHPWLSQDMSSAPHINFQPELSHDELDQTGKSPIDHIIIDYLDTMVRMDPNFTPPAAEGAGMTNMAHKYGFVIKS